jgi:hypothetical protein
VQTAPAPGPAEVARALQKVYARPEFAPERTSGVLRWLGDLWKGVTDWIGSVLGGLVDRLHLLEHTAPVLFWLLVGWMVVSAVAIAVHLAVTLAQGLRTRERAADAAAGGAGAGAGPRPRTPEAWDEEARSAVAEGRLRDAAVATYQALLLRLDARGVVRYDAAKTPGEYRRETRRDPAVAGSFGGFLRAFEPVAFGGRALDGAGYERLRAAASEAAGRG